MSYTPVNDGVRVKGRSVHWEAKLGPHDWIKTSRFTLGALSMFSSCHGSADTGI